MPKPSNPHPNSGRFLIPRAESSHIGERLDMTCFMVGFCQLSGLLSVMMPTARAPLMGQAGENFVIRAMIE